MGLDMYLNRMPRYRGATVKDVEVIEGYFSWKEKCKDPDSNAKKYTLKDWCGVDEKDVPSGGMLEFYRHFYNTKYSFWDDEHKYGSDAIMEQVGYWRKANEIHRWFVENVQDGIDDCEYHKEVTEEKLKELLAICQKIKDIAIMESAPVVNGYQYKNGEEAPIYEDGAQIVNADEVAALLPTQGGFFFGGTGYDSYYMQDIEETIDILTNVLTTTDFDTEMVYYVSSW